MVSQPCTSLRSVADKDRVFSLVADAADPFILYAGLDGGGRVYKTVDGGATWAPSASGLPAKARVAQLLISPHSAAVLYAATQIGLYRSTDAGATWALAGFAGRAIRGVAQSGLEAGLLLGGGRRRRRPVPAYLATTTGKNSGPASYLPLPNVSSIDCTSRWRRKRARSIAPSLAFAAISTR